MLSVVRSTTFSIGELARYKLSPCGLFSWFVIKAETANITRKITAENVFKVFLLFAIMTQGKLRLPEYFASLTEVPQFSWIKLVK